MSSDVDKANLVGRLMDESYADSCKYLEIETKEIKDLYLELK